MDLPSATEGGAAGRALLRREVRALRPQVLRPVLFGLAAMLACVGGAWFTARLLSTLLGWPGAGWPELAIAATFAAAAAAAGYAQERTQLAAGEAARARLRGAAMARLLEIGPADPRGVGERASLVVDRVEALDGYFARWLPAATLALLAPLVVLIAALATDLAAFTVLLAAGLLYPVVTAISGFGAAQASRAQFDALQRLSGRFLDRLRGLSTLVLFNRQDAEAAALDNAADELRARTLRVLRLAFLSTTALELLSALSVGLLAWHHAGRLGAGGGDPTPAIFALLLVPAFFAPLRAFSAAYHERLSAEGAAAALAPLLLPEPAPPGLLLEEIPRRVVVAFSDVRLMPDPARPPALDGLTFRVSAGETLVLAGPSGAGKTSVLRLLMGFARPDGGRVAINGQDATALRPSELRRLSAYVGQRPHLFRASLRENIRLARPDADGRGGGGGGTRGAGRGFRGLPAAGARHDARRGRLGLVGRASATRRARPRLPAGRAAGAAGRTDRAP